MPGPPTKSQKYDPSFTSETKSKKGRRRIPLARRTVNALHEHRKRMLAEGRDVKKGPVFCNTRGGFLRKRNFARDSFRPLLKKAGRPPVRFHDLRHTCVTLLLDAGVPPHVVQAIAGHSGIQVTMSIYAHAAQEEQRKALSSLGERLA